MSQLLFALGIALFVLSARAAVYAFDYLKTRFSANSERYNELQRKIGELQSQLDTSRSINTELHAKIDTEQAAFAKLQHQTKSSQVRTGFLAEAMLPLTSQFPCDPKSLRFLGSPIDFVSFDYEADQITFVECKTGDSQLNENQRAVKKMVENGKVKFVTVRLNEDGIKVK